MPRPIEPEDINRLRPPFDAQISPSGKHVLFHLRVAAGEKIHTHLWMTDIVAGRTRPFTHGAHADALGRWSPDGARIAFVRTTDDGAQVYMMDADGGEPRPLTTLEPGSVSGLWWSPDGARLAIVYRRRPRKDKKPPAVRHITTLNWRFEGVGTFDGEMPHLWVVDVSTGAATQIADGRWGEHEAAWAPDGLTIAFTANRHEDAEYQGEQFDLWLVDAGGGEPRRIATPPGAVCHPAFSHDGTRIAYLGHDDPEGPWGVRNQHPWVVTLDGNATNLTPSLDRTAGNQTVSDLWAFHGDPGVLAWAPDDSRVYHLISDRGSVQVCAAGLRLTEGRHDIRSFTLSADGRRAALLIATPTNPGSIFTAAIETPLRPKKLHDPNAELLAELQIAAPEEIDAPVHGWLLKPADFDASRKYPLCFEIHGGPRAQYGETFFHEFQLLAAQGYVVLYTNPRGSQGYGEAYAGAISGDWGGVDYADLMAAVDAVVARGFIDTTRMAVMGGSYGGYMTNWIVGHTDRFACGVSMRCVSNLISMEGTSDIGYDCRREFGVHPWEDAEKLWRMSPLAYAGNVKTPLLIIHGEADLRCRLEQGEQMYRFLKGRRVETELVAFPESNHDLSRAGRPDRRVLRLQHILRWLRKHL